MALPLQIVDAVVNVTVPATDGWSTDTVIAFDTAAVHGLLVTLTL